MNRDNFVKFFLISCLLGTGQAMIQDGLAKVFGSVGSVTNVKTNQLLNQLCSESQNDNVMKRDACYGCFFRSSQEPSGYPMLLSMAACADSYLNNTDYGHCRAYLRNTTSAINSRASPTTIYCTFLECIRQVNKDNLDALIALRRKIDRRSKKAKFVARKTRSALILRQYIVALRGICIVRRINTDSNTVRPGAEPISPRRNNYIGRKNIMFPREKKNKMNNDEARNDRERPYGNGRVRSYNGDDSYVRGRVDKNVFQFYINGRLPRPAFREYDRLYSREDALLPYESNYRGLSAGGRYY